jgi:hypothetical protein
MPRFFRSPFRRRLLARARRCQPTVETLEDRNLLAITLPTPGTPGPVTLTGTPGPDQFVISLKSGSPSTIRFSDNGGASFLEAALADVTGITVNGLAGNDVLTIDNNNGLVANSAGSGLPITFDGGTGVSTLRLVGNPGSPVNQTYTMGSATTATTLNSTNGSLSQRISFSNVAVVIDITTSSSLAVNLNTNRHVVAVTQGQWLNGIATMRIGSINATDLDYFPVQRMALQPQTISSEDTVENNLAGPLHDNTSSAFVPIVVGNIRNVTINSPGGNDYLSVNVAYAPASLTGLTVNGGGNDVLAMPHTPSGVVVTPASTPNGNGIQKVLTNLDDIFVEELYQLRLNRSADANGFASARAYLQQTGNRLQLAASLDSSWEAQQDLVRNWYWSILGRPVDSVGLNSAVNALLNGAPEENLVANLAASSEFVSRAQSQFPGSSPNVAFVNLLFQILFNRTPTPAEVNIGLQYVVSDPSAVGRSHLVLAWMATPEYRTQVVYGMYTDLLHRQADQGGVNGWASSNLSLKVVRERIMASAEFHDNAVAPPPNDVTPPPPALTITSLVPGSPAPQLVGASITWTATAINWQTAPVYQFSVGPGGGPFQVVRDFSPSNTFAWVPMQEGTYNIRVTVKEGFNATTSTSYVVADTVNSRVAGSTAVVTATANPLVALYSVPPVAGGTVSVQFSPLGASTWQSTNTVAVVPGKSTNFFVAGLLPNTTYQMRYVLSDGTASAPVLFTTGSLPSNLVFPTFTVDQAPGAGSDLSQGMILHMPLFGTSPSVNLLGTNLLGQVDWYYDPVAAGLVDVVGTSLVPGGTVLVLGSTSTHDPLFGGNDVLREVDLAGNTLRETSVDAVNAQLRARGLPPIDSFHHDAQRLPNGYTAVLAHVRKTIDVNGTPTDFLGDMVIVLDNNFQVTWTWNAFDFLDTNREVLGNPSDWTHGNSVAWSPADGNLIVSLRNQNWVIKINYANGAGDGHVVWRLGAEGNFTINSSDPNPWFSGQHDAHYINPTTLVVFDDGNSRSGDSRGQVLVLNEQTLVATLVLNADLGNFSPAVGSAQSLPNGNFVFTSGLQFGPQGIFGQSIEVLPNGTITYELEVNSIEYRSYRIGDLYEGTNNNYSPPPPLTIASLVPGSPGPQLVGDSITWTATAINWQTAPVYQFSVGPSGGLFQVVRDFSPSNSFAWVPMQEGSYNIRVSVKEGFNATTSTSYVVADTVNSRVTGSTAVVTATANPLVALYSVPPAAGGTASVQFSPLGDSSTWQSTNTVAVVPGKSTNFFVAGLLPNTTYQMRYVLSDGTVSAPVLFTTGSLPSNLVFPTFTVDQTPGAGSDLSQGMILHMPLLGPAPAVNLLATDLMGNIDWYYDPVAAGLVDVLGTSLVPGGTVLLLGSSSIHDPGYGGNDLLREVDLAGNTLRETSVDAVNAQLRARGFAQIDSFHHDAQRLPNGYTAVLAHVRKTIDVNGTPTDYLGDMVIVLDSNFQVTWTWNAFDFLDTNREVLGNPSDWTHANSVAWSPADGNLIVSLRNQSWVIKINYANGTGDGHVVWRLGADGNFTINSSDPSPWFSGQHNAHYINPTTLVVFDDGNNRGGDSRGQVLVLNEQTLEATLVVNADLGNFSPVVGSAQSLSNGNFVFTSGAQFGPQGTFGQSIEVLPDGTITYALEVNSIEYRSYRTGDLYEGTN